MAAVAQLEGGDVVTLRVGDEAGVAPAGMGVEERELGARDAGARAGRSPACRRGQPLSSYDLGEFDHLGTVADPATEFCRFHPVLFLGEQQGVTHRTADGKANRVLEVGVG